MPDARAVVMTKSPSSRWIICGLLLLATILNYLDRQTISVSATKIAAEMGLNDWHLGRLFSGFLLAYGVSQIVVGPLLDRFGTVAAFAVAVTSWSLAGASSGLATGFWFLFGTRVALGICESPNWPLALRTVTRVFPASERALANGIFQSGTSIGALIAPPIIIYLTKAYGWRASFYVIGAVGLIWSVIWLAWFRLRPEPALEDLAPPTEAATPSAQKSPGSLREILRARAFWGMVIASTFINPLQYFYTTWLPRYFDKYAGVGFGQDLAHRLVIVYLALDVGLWSGGALVAILAKRWNVLQARLTVTSTGAACMMLVPLVSRLQDLDAITAMISLATFGLGWFIVNYLAFTSEVSATRVSTVAGLLGGIGSLAGAGFVLLVGGTIEASGSFGIAFLMAGAMPVISLGGIWLSTRARSAGT